ncbi:MAG: thioesterase family protein [Dehalococcoidia bacterium]
MPITADDVGQSAADSVTVTEEHFASKVFPGAPDVFSTPSLGALVEATAAAWLQERIGPGEMSVGTQLVINHTAATPPGLVVFVEVKVASVDGRRIDFEWTARDDREDVGYGTHQRFVVDRERFNQRVAEKSR